MGGIAGGRTCSKYDAEWCGGGSRDVRSSRSVTEKSLCGGSRCPLELCSPAVVSRPTGEYALRKLKVRGRNKKMVKK